MVISWVIEAVFDLLIEHGRKAAKRSDTDVDDDAIDKIESSRSIIIKYAKGKL